MRALSCNTHASLLRLTHCTWLVIRRCWASVVVVTGVPPLPPPPPPPPPENEDGVDMEGLADDESGLDLTKVEDGALTPQMEAAALKTSMKLSVQTAFIHLSTRIAQQSDSTRAYCAPRINGCLLCARRWRGRAGCIQRRRGHGCGNGRGREGPQGSRHVIQGLGGLLGHIFVRSSTQGPEGRRLFKEQRRPSGGES